MGHGRAYVELSGAHSPTGLAPGKTHTQNEIPEANASGIAGGSDRRRSGDLSIFSRTLYQLSYRALDGVGPAMMTGPTRFRDLDGT